MVPYDWVVIHIHKSHLFWCSHLGTIGFDPKPYGFSMWSQWSLSGWWLNPTPLKNMRNRQLGWQHSQYFWKKKHVPVTTNQLCFWYYSTSISQLGWWHSQYMEKSSSHVPVTTNQCIYIYIEIIHTISIDYPYITHIFSTDYVPVTSNSSRHPAS